MTTVRGITSRVDIVWTNDDVELDRTENISIAFRTDNMMKYKNMYTITLLKDTDINRTYQCEMLINSVPPVLVNDAVTLDVTSKHSHNIFHYNIWSQYHTTHQSLFCKHNLKTMSKAAVLS